MHVQTPSDHPHPIVMVHLVIPPPLWDVGWMIPWIVEVPIGFTASEPHSWECPPLWDVGWRCTWNQACIYARITCISGCMHALHA